MLYGVSRKGIGQRHVTQAPGYTGRRAVETSRRSYCVASAPDRSGSQRMNEEIEFDDVARPIAY